MTWACFMVEPTDEQEAWLRRYADGPCPAKPGEHSYHDGSAHVGRVPVVYGKVDDEPTHSYIEETSVEGYHGDERWPIRCACGYEFGPDDHWQVLGRQVWRRPDTGEARALHGYWRNDEQVPVWGPGAMFYAWWMEGWRDHLGPEGKCLSVVLPPSGSEHIWHIDGPASSGGHWSRTGEPPLISVTPSISTGAYHGWLGVNGSEPGVLSDDLDGRDVR